MSTRARPFAVQRIDHVVLRVRDLPRAVAFYGEVLGCEVVRHREDLGLVHLRAGASLVDLVAVDGPTGRKGGAPAGREGRNLDHLCLRVEPFDATALAAFLDGHAVEWRPGLPRTFGAEGHGPSLYLSDPDGNLVELKGPAGAGDGAGD